MKTLLLSGGLESTALAYGEKPDLCLTIAYGQPALIGEIQASKAICKILNLRHQIISTDVYQAPKRKARADLSWWPFRNQLLISLAAAHLGGVQGASILVGFVKDDIYSDCTSTFVDGINRLLELQEAACTVIAPGLGASTQSLLLKYKVPYSLLGLSLSCHMGPIACGQCNGCTKSKRVLSSYKKRSKFSLVA